jgi:hypothetical protein
MIKFLICLLLITCPVFASPEEVGLLLDKIASIEDTAQRMELVSEQFLGLPYGDGGPLGEGPQGRYDQDPIYRFDTFDCTTFVETIVTLARVRSIEEFEKQILEIRYENGEVDFLKRNHFPSLQWIPFNIRNGILHEVNHKIAPAEETLIANAVISYPGWLSFLKPSDLKVPMASPEELQSLVEELHSFASQYQPVEVNLEYIPLTYFLADPERLKNIKHGTIVNFVRPNWDLTRVIGTHMNVSHQGFLFWKEDILYLRHASTSSDKKVAELPFIEYLKKFENHPTLKGVHFMEVN